MEKIFVSTDKVKALGNLFNVDKEDALTVHFAGAQRDVLDMIGSETYEAVFDKTAPYDESDYQSLEDAESYFALRRVVMALNISSSGNGMTKATGFGDGRQENISFSEVRELKEQYEAEAMRILKKYITAPDNDADESPDSVITNALQMLAI